MKPIRRILLPLVLAVLALPVVAGVRCERDPEARFTGRATFTLAESEGSLDLHAAEPAIDSVVKATLRREMEAKGLRFVESGDADLLVTYGGALTERLRVSGANDSRLGCRWCDEDVQVVGYDQVAYTVEVSDGSTRQLMWRGSVSDARAAPEHLPRQAERLLVKLLKRYPLR